jgi:hypothetical protein
MVQIAFYLLLLQLVAVGVVHLLVVQEKQAVLAVVHEEIMVVVLAQVLEPLVRVMVVVDTPQMLLKVVAVVVVLAQ